MKAPGFWAKRGVLAYLLAPLGAITAAVTARRVKKPGFAPGIKVICVGNAGVGGAGKTVVALDLLHRLQRPALRAHPRLSRPAGRAGAGQPDLPHRRGCG